MTFDFSRIVWSALTTRQADVSVGAEGARRYHPDVSVFAATGDDSRSSLDALAALVRPGESGVYMLQADPIALPDALVADKTALGVALVKRRAGKSIAGHAGIQRLQAEDADDMCALAELTKPGPFRPRTPELGAFWGVKIDGRLAAMAGERFKVPGYTEVSGVCTHPDFRGRGLASALSAHVAAIIEARGETPFLHSYADNDGALALYASLGFDVEMEVNVAVVRRSPA